MAKIPFTNRELVRAWRNSLDVSKSEQRTNPHRLLLFYAIECGLKAAYLKQINKTVIDSDIAQQFSGRDADLVVMVDCQIPSDDLIVHFF